MNSHRSFCPGCKKEVVFETLGHTRRCPACGFQFELSPPATHSTWEKSTLADLLGLFGKVLLIMLAIGVIGIGILFAGCALLMKGI